VAGMSEHVKICPTCGEQNAAVAQRCACGAFLIGVDVVERLAIASVAPFAESVPPDAATSGVIEAAAPLPDVALAPDAAAAPAVAASEPGVSGPEPPPAAVPALCPHADCAQPNPPGTATCLYCNRPMATSPAGRDATTSAPPHESLSSGAASPPSPPSPLPGEEGRVGSTSRRAGFGADVTRSPEGAGRAGDAAASRTVSVPAAATSRPATSGNTTPGSARRNLITLPDELAQRLTIVEPLKAAGGEADLFVVHDRTRDVNAVLKLYRHGVEPKTDVLERVSRAEPDQVVQLLDFGVADGVPYELLEYCEHGSLRTLLKGRPIPPESVRTILTELADAIDHLHGHGIVHRDLKPENVLVRGLLPLDLVLTDFGISSVASATMHYTSAARTLRYSAPETGSNWVGKPSDYWSLGMMLAEALAGRHPYEGLSEAVIAHQLVTKPVDVSAVQDARWRTLCRGLLTRDPKLRWGADEIRRWLEGDTSLAVADEPATPAGATHELRAYRIEGEECRTAGELAAALARHWRTGVLDLRHGILRGWVQNELRDLDLTRFVARLEEDPTCGPDEKLVRLVRRLDPALPPVYQGYDVSRAGLAALAARAVAEDGEARAVVRALMEHSTLLAFGDQDLDAVHTAHAAAREQAAAAFARARAAGAPASVTAEGVEWDLQLFAAVADPTAAASGALRTRANAIAGGVARHCAWYGAMAEAATATAAELAALVVAGPAAVQAGIEALVAQTNEAARGLRLTIAGTPRIAHLQERLAALEAAIAAANDEPEALALPATLAALESDVRAAVAALWQEEVFVARRITADDHLRALRHRISAYARQRAGEGYAAFGERIEIVAAIGRRAYTVRLDSQIEARRTSYKYTESDRARMPALARAAVLDPWVCPMPALPQLAADFRMGGDERVRCPRCGQEASVRLNESWGSKGFLFTTAYACHDRVGIQAQVRSITAKDRVPPAFVPASVADLIEALATEETAPERTVEVVVPQFDAGLLDPMPDGPVKEATRASAAAAVADLEEGQRITAQRLRLRWSGLVEVRYRYEGRDWLMWVPARADRKPIDPESPLPKEPPALADAAAESDSAPEPARARPVLTPVPAPAPGPAAQDVREVPRGAPSPAWLRHVLVWGAIVLVLWLAVKAMVG